MLHGQRLLRAHHLLREQLEGAPVELAAHVGGKSLSYDEFLGHLELRNSRLQMLAKFFFLEHGSGDGHNERYNSLPGDGIRRAEHGCLSNIRVLHECAFDLCGRNVHAAANDQVAHAADDKVIAVGIPLEQVTGPKPPVRVEPLLRHFRLGKIAGQISGTPYECLSHLAYRNFRGAPILHGLGTRGHDALIAVLVIAREATGLTQREVAQRLPDWLGWNHGTIAKVETGRRNLSLTEARELVKLYGTNIGAIDLQAEAYEAAMSHSVRGKPLKPAKRKR